MRALVALIAVAVFAGCGAGAESGRLPDVTVSSLAGADVSLSEISGPAVINFWATSCAPCVREMPALQQAADQRPEVAFYGINVAEQRDAVEEFVQRLDVTYTQLLDERGYVAEDLDITSMPTTLVIGADGAIAERHRGEITADQLASLLDADTGATVAETDANG